MPDPSKKKPSKKKKDFILHLTRLAAEARIAEELELKKREQNERKRQQEEDEQKERDRILEEDQHRRLAAEASIESATRDTKYHRLMTAQSNIQQQTSWKHYIDCNPLPDVRDQAQLHTYLSLWSEEEVDVGPTLSLESAVEKCSNAELVIALLESIAGEALEEDASAKGAWIYEYTRCLRAVSKLKLDAATLQVLGAAEGSAIEDAHTGTVVTAHARGDLGMGVWAHTRTARDKRAKQVSFPALGVDIDLPAALQNTRTSLRVIRTAFNPLHDDQATHALVSEQDLSILHQCVAAAPKLRPPPGANAAFAPYLAHADAQAHLPRTPTAPAAPITETGSRARALADLAQYAPRDALSWAWRAGKQSGSSLPSTHAGSAAPHLLSPSHWAVAGGVLLVEQLALPAPTKRWAANAPLLREHAGANGRLVQVPYPAAAAGHAPAPTRAEAARPVDHTKVSGGEMEGDGDAPEQLHTAPDPDEAVAPAQSQSTQGPVTLSFTLHKDVVVGGARPLLACWDGTRHGWDASVPLLLAYNPASRRVTVQLSALLPLAMLVPRYADAPLRFWRIRPMRPAAVQVTLQGSRFAVEVEVTGVSVRLLAPALPELADLIGAHLPPGLLVRLLAARGVHLAHRPQARGGNADSARLPWKQAALRELAISECACLGCVCELQAHPANAAAGADTALVWYRFCPPQERAAASPDVGAGDDAITTSLAATLAQRLNDPLALAAETAALAAAAAAPAPVASARTHACVCGEVPCVCGSTGAGAADQGSQQDLQDPLQALLQGAGADTALPAAVQAEGTDDLPDPSADPATDPAAGAGVTRVCEATVARDAARVDRSRRAALMQADAYAPTEATPPAPWEWPGDRASSLALRLHREGPDRSETDHVTGPLGADWGVLRVATNGISVAVAQHEVLVPGVRGGLHVCASRAVGEAVGARHPHALRLIHLAQQLAARLEAVRAKALLCPSCELEVAGKTATDDTAADMDSDEECQRVLAGECPRCIDRVYRSCFADAEVAVEEGSREVQDAVDAADQNLLLTQQTLRKLLTVVAPLCCCV